MTNGEKYKTAEERKIAYLAYISKDSNHVIGEFTWLDLEAEEEKPMPCPFCGGEVVLFEKKYGRAYKCDCGYRSELKPTKPEVIAAHNRVCKAVAANKESEVK